MYVIGLLKIQDYTNFSRTKVEQVACTVDLTDAGKIADLGK